MPNWPRHSASHSVPARSRLHGYCPECHASKAESHRRTPPAAIPVARLPWGYRRFPHYPWRSCARSESRNVADSVDFGILRLDRAHAHQFVPSVNQGRSMRRRRRRWLESSTSNDGRSKREIAPTRRRQAGALPSGRSAGRQAGRVRPWPRLGHTHGGS